MAVEFAHFPGGGPQGAICAGCGHRATVATLDPEEAMFVARSIQSLASAAKADTDRELKVRAEVAKEAAAAAAKVAKDQGLTKDTVALITREILGIGK